MSTVTWYECSYPGLPYPYYCNVKERVASYEVPKEEATTGSIKELGIDQDVNDEFCYYCAKVNKEFIKLEHQEINLQLDEVVIVLTPPVQEWVYVENLKGESGYAPFAYISAILPSNERVCDYRPSDILVPLSSAEELNNGVHVVLRQNARRPTQTSKELQSDDADEFDYATLRRLTRSQINFSFPGTQSDNTIITLIREMFPIFLRNVLDTLPLTPYDLWVIDVTHNQLNIQQSAFEKFLQDCNFDLERYNDLISQMDFASQSSFVSLDFSELAHPQSTIYHTVSFTSDAKPIYTKSTSHTEKKYNTIHHPAENQESQNSHKKESNTEMQSSTSSLFKSLQPTTQPIINKTTSALSSTSHTPMSEETTEMAYDANSIIYSDIDMYDFTNYASIYFQREKPRLFHPFSLTELVSYTGRIPLQPLHPISFLSTESVLDLERKVLMWMNVVLMEITEDKSEEMRISLLEQIVYQSLQSEEVADEIMCFILKQVNNNPNEKSIEAGLQCLYVMICLRKPSSVLFKYVLNFLHQRIIRRDVIGGIACMTEIELLNDDVNWFYHNFDMVRFKEACEMVKHGDEMILNVQLFDDISIKKIMYIENTVELLLKHGLLPPTGMCYAWVPEIPQCVTTTINFSHMLSALLQGIIVFIGRANTFEFKERILRLDSSLLKLTWVSTNPTKVKVRELSLSAITDVVCNVSTLSYGADQRDLYSFQIFANESEDSIDVAVMSPPERYRIMQFLNYMIKWYRLCNNEIMSIIKEYEDSDNEAIAEQQENQVYYPKLRRSLENYLNKQTSTPLSSQYFNSLPYDQTTPTVFGISSLNSSISSQSSTAGARSTKSARSTSKNGLDFASLNAMNIEMLKKNQLLQPSIQSASSSLTKPKLEHGSSSLTKPKLEHGSSSSSLYKRTNIADNSILQDLIPYKHHMYIPRILLLLSQRLNQLEAYKTEGIFRQSAAYDEQKWVISRMSLGGYDTILATDSCHTIANVMKDFLRHLKPSLVPPSYWEQIVNIGKNARDTKSAWNLIRTIPEPNFSTLMFLLTMMYKYSLVESNKMSLNSFIRMLSPNIIALEAKTEEDETLVQIQMANDHAAITNFFTELAATLPDNYDISVFKEDFPFV